MKANEAPEKIYINFMHKTLIDILSVKVNNNDIEYTRTDAFIEKAEEWLRNKQRGFILTDKDITDFVNDMKGE